MALKHAILTNDFASEWMGIELIEIAPHRAVIEMELRQEMLNGFGIAHGGMIFAFADTAFALACNDSEGDGETITVASGADINFIAPARQGQRLRATAVQQASMGRSGIYDIRVTAGETLIAEFRGRSRTIPQPKTK